MADNSYDIRFNAPDGFVPAPPLEQVSALLSELSQIDLLHTDVETLKARLHLLTRGHTSHVTYFEAGALFYRGRVMPTPPKHVVDVGSPPESIVTKYGRANRPGKSVLYTNRSPTGVFKEIQASPGQVVALASYRAKRRIICLPVGFNDAAILAKGWARQPPHWTLERDGQFGHEFNQIVSEFFAHQFLKQVSQGNEHLYKLSVAWSEILLSIDAVDAVGYPSVANLGSSDNVAFKTAPVDMLELERVDMVRLVEQDENNTGFIFLKKTNGITPNGALKFKGANPVIVPNQSRLNLLGGVSDVHLLGGLWVVKATNGDRIAWESDYWLDRWRAEWFGKRGGRIVRIQRSLDQFKHRFSQRLLAITKSLWS